MGDHEAKPARTVGPVTIGASAGSAVAIAIAGTTAWILGENGIEMPETVVGYLATIIGFAGAVIGGWLVRPPQD